MGGGASKRAALAEELNSRVAARDEDTLSMVEQDKKRRAQHLEELPVCLVGAGGLERRLVFRGLEVHRRVRAEVHKVDRGRLGAGPPAAGLLREPRREVCCARPGILFLRIVFG